MIVRQCAWAAALLAGIAGAQGPFLIYDLDQRTPSYPGGGWPGGACRLGAACVFSAGAAGVETGCELWASDGTPAGTRLLRDVNPGTASSDPYLLGAWGGRVFFRADDGVHGKELWATDGTPAGTRLVLDIAPGGADSFPHDMCALGDRFFFQADDGVHGIELWASDGTEAGTRLVRDLVPGPNGHRIQFQAVLDDRAFFYAGGDDDWALWVSDGTEAGTTFLHARVLERVQAAVLGGRVFFVTPSEWQDAEELWVTDGTPAGTSFLHAAWTRVTYLKFEHDLHVCGERLFFAGLDAAHGAELWSTDGTAAGTNPVREIMPGEGGSAPRFLASAGGRTLFVADDGDHGLQPWVTDGTESGTVLLGDILGHYASIVHALFVSGDQIYFATANTGGYGYAYNSLWLTDCTPAGTQCLEGGVWPWSFSLYRPALVPFGEGLYFCARLDNDHGGELCVTDGTAGGARIVKDIVPGWRSSGCSIIGRLDNVLLLSADDGVRGQELWASDGTADGTACIADIVTSKEITMGSMPRFKVAGDTVYMWCESTYALWRTDGTAEGTQVLPDYLSTEFNMLAGTSDGGLVYKAVGPGGTGVTWYTDGTVESALSLEALGGMSAGAWVESAIPAGERIFLLVGVPDGSYELWAFDRAERTVGRMSATARSYAYDAYGHALHAGRLYYAGVDPDHGVEPWVSDGTAAGTFLVKDVNPGEASGVPEGSLVATVAGSTVFFIAEDGLDGPDVWITDGTEAGTRKVRDFGDGGVAGLLQAQGPWNQRWLVTAAGKVFFSDAASEGSLWVSDGTEAGTGRLLECAGGSFCSAHLVLGVLGDRMIFSADDGVHGYEPWSTDGTPAGTRLIMDTVPGPGAALAQAAFVAGRRIFFVVLDSESGTTRLWVTDGTEGGAYPLFGEDTPPWAPWLGLAVVDDKVVFPVAPPGVYPMLYDLWLSDGTPEGTHSLLEGTPVRCDALPLYPGENVPLFVFLPARRLLLFPGDDGRLGAEPWAVFIPPEPTPIFSLTPEGCQSARSVVADASAATTPEGTAIVSYAWDMGDGAMLAGPRVEHTYGPDAYGVQRVSLTVTNDAGYARTHAKEFCIRSRFVRGDANGSATTDIADAIFLLSHLFAAGPAPSCRDAGDANDDEKLDIADAIALLSHLFASAGPLPPPFGACGEDLTESSLECLRYGPCE
ncbi:MAG TPA: hypothetical protein DCM87_21960 [Planctomycetes bacterium]|nr:hypothetical protein [Planctomycetota bacterium]